MNTLKIKNIFQKITIIGLILISSLLDADKGQPDLWKIEKDGIESFLFGSIHLGKQDLYPLSEKVYNAYEKSDALVVEFDIKMGDELKMMQLIQQYGIDKKIPLEDKLSPENLIIYKDFCASKKLPCEQFRSLKPWLLGLQFSVQQMLSLGYQEELGIDKHFLNKAHESKKNIISLESAEFQIKLFLNFSKTQQETMLVQSMSSTDEYFHQLFEAWKNGDDDLMLNLFNRDIEIPGVREMNKVMLDDRNLGMVDKIIKELNKKKSLFVVVGAGHMVGEMGLVKLLQDKGFKITQLQ